MQTCCHANGNLLVEMEVPVLITEQEGTPATVRLASQGLIVKVTLMSAIVLPASMKPHAL